MHFLLRAQSALGFLSLILGLMLQDGLALAGDVTNQVTITSMTLVSSVRVSRTVYDYSYRINLNNTGAALTDVVATVTSSSPRTLIVDATVEVGNVGANSTITPDATFTLRHDRTVLISSANLAITLSGTIVRRAPGEGVLLEGAPDSPVLGALVPSGPVPVAAGDMVDGFALTRLMVAMDTDSTVGEINDALQVVGGGIVTMQPGLSVLTVAVPRQVDGAALRALASSLGAQPGILLSLPGRAVGLNESPGGRAAEGNNLRHLEAARFPAAWNARLLAGNCSSGDDKVVVIVADSFDRSDALAPAYVLRIPVEVPGLSLLGSGSVDSPVGLHGYDTLTTLAGTLDADPPTGANPFPECLDMRALQVGTLGTWLDIALAIAAATPPAANVVLNASFGFPESCDVPCTAGGLVVMSAFERATAGAVMRHVMRSLRDRLLVVAAAGNSAVKTIGAAYPGVSSADFSSPFTIAARSDSGMSWVTNSALWESALPCTPEVCFPSLTATAAERADLDELLRDLGEQDGAPLTDVLVVGSQVFGNRSLFSEPDADIHAFAEEIPVVGGVPVSGTSSAAPQVAGLASYLWTISPERRRAPDLVETTIQAILSNETTFGYKQIDAYAAALSLDPAGDPDPATWMVRSAILDVTTDGRFSETDIADFIQHFYEAPAFVDPVQPQAADDSEYDLNGDGRTGGTTATTFDLDRNGSTRNGAPLLTQVDIQLGGARRDIHESLATDLDILCFYAYSSLYQGLESEREQLLANRCLTISVVVDPGAANVGPGGTIAFSADVSGTSDPRVTWFLPDGGGTIDTEGVFTAGTDLGTFAVRAISVIDPGAFADATVTVGDGPVISRGTITAGYRDSNGLFPNETANYSLVVLIEGEVTAQGFVLRSITGSYSSSNSLGCSASGPIVGGTFHSESGGFLGLSLNIQSLSNDPARCGSGRYTTGLTSGTRILDSDGVMIGVDFNYQDEFSHPTYSYSYSQAGRVAP